MRSCTTAIRWAGIWESEEWMGLQSYCACYRDSWGVRAQLPQGFRAVGCGQTSGLRARQRASEHVARRGRPRWVGKGVAASEHALSNTEQEWSCCCYFFRQIPNFGSVVCHVANGSGKKVPMSTKHLRRDGQFCRYDMIEISDPAPGGTTWQSSAGSLSASTACADWCTSILRRRAQCASLIASTHRCITRRAQRP